MSKIDELFTKKSEAIARQEEIVSGFNSELNDIDNEIDDLVAEFKRKVRSTFRGVRLHITVDHDELNVQIGDTAVHYSATNFSFREDILTQATAEKIRDLFIEYFGKFKI